MNERGKVKSLLDANSEGWPYVDYAYGSLFFGLFQVLIG